jgi:rhombotail lipoprotein
MKKLIAILLTGAAGAGCASGFDRVAMETQLQEDRRIFTDDDDVLRIEQLRPQIQFPFRLAVVPPLHLHRSWSDDVGGTEGERDEILAWGDKLKKEGIVSDFTLIPSMLLDPRGNTLKSIRIAAARLQADAVLILHSITEVDSYVNPLGVLDLTIAGMFLVPGHKRDALTIVEGMVIDNRNQFLYFAGSSEGTGATLAPLATIEKKDAIRESRRNALRSFGEILVQEGRRVRSYVPGTRYETPGRK